jgi:hypothetical protein
MSWPRARKVVTPVAEAVALGVTDGVDGVDGTAAVAAVGEAADVGELAGVLAELTAVELPDELQAATSTAVPASTAPATTRLALREFAVNMKFHSFSFHGGSARHVISTTPAGPRWLEPPVRGLNHGPFRINITAGTGDGGQRTERTRVIAAAAASEARPASAKSDG